jgi:predicted  nucleic acid-binding Zn-ribbon protein
MALTLQQRADTRRFLGWSAQFSQTDNALENAFDGLETQPEHEAQVISLLAEIESIRTKLTDSHNRLKAVKVGSIELNTYHMELTALRDEGMRLTGELASIMGVERRHNIFSNSSPSRQGWYGPTGYRGEGGNYIG